MALPVTDTWTSGTTQGIAAYGPYAVLEGALDVEAGNPGVGITGGSYNTARRTDETPTAAQYSQVVITAGQIAGSMYTGPAVRCQSGANSSYHVETNGSEYYVSKCLAGSQSTLAGGITQSFAAGDVLRLEVEEVTGTTTLRVYKALAASPTTFSLLGTYTDTTSPITSAGYLGIFGYGSIGSRVIGTWTAGNLGGGGGPDPTVTDVDTDEAISDGQTSVAITGADMGTSNADRTYALVQGAVAVNQTETGTGTATAATINVNCNPGGAGAVGTKYGTASLRCTLTSGGANGSLSVTVNAPSGVLYVDIGTPDTAAQNRISSTPVDIASGDHVQARGLGGGSAPTGLSLASDGTYSFSSGNDPTAFEVRIWDATDGTYSAWVRQDVSTAITGKGRYFVSSAASDLDNFQNLIYGTDRGAGKVDRAAVLSWNDWLFPAAAAGVTVNLTGQAMTGAQGSIPAAIAAALSGSAATVSAGTLTPVRSITLTGLSATASLGSLVGSISAALSGIAAAMTAGTLVPGSTIPLAGQAASTAQGTITFSSGGNVTVSLTGQAMSAAAGALLPALTIALTGQASSTAAGTLTPARSVSLTGLAAAGAQGALSPAIAAALAGMAATASPGTVTPARSLTLAGQQASMAQGSVTLAAALQLVGAALALAQGTVTANAGSNVTVTLTGQQIAAAAGTLTPAMLRTLAGSSATAAQGSVTPEKGFALAGQSVSVAQGTLALQRALALLGISSTVTPGTITLGNNLVINLTGLAMAMGHGSVAPTFAVALIGTQAQSVPGTITVNAPTPPVPDGRANPDVAGRYASPNPPRVMQSLDGGTLRAGEAGCRVGRFAWADGSGLVGNQKTGRLGFAVLQPQYWYGGYWSGGDLVLRAGQPISLLTAGDVWVRFDSGCVAGAQVYADTLTGKAVSGYSATGEATPWYVVRSAGPGDLAVISTTSRVQ